MKIVLEPSYDYGIWPGPLHGKEAIAGQAWTGLNGLLGILETALGLGGLNHPSAVRAVTIVDALRTTEGFWSESTETDPLGTAKGILSWRDQLWMSGWNGEAVSPRLGQLNNVTEDLLPGVPDRIRVVYEALESRKPDIESIEIIQPTDDLSHLWRLVLDRLAEGGIQTTERHLEPASANGDLLEARGHQFIPEGDGSLQLFRPQGPLEAAEEVAAWITSRSTDGEILIITPDMIVDSALQRFGLPATGAKTEIRESSLLQILPLVLEMGWLPPDPQRVLKLLNMPVSPIPGGLSRRLINALNEWPAVGSEKWSDAIDSWIGSLSETAGDDPDKRERLVERVRMLLTPAVERRNQYPIREIDLRIEALLGWLFGRQAADITDNPAWGDAILQCSIAQRLFRTLGGDRIGEPLIRRVIQEATAEIQTRSAHAPQAGINSVGSPGSVAGPADTIIWWNFTRGAAPSIPRLPFTIEEKKALEELGVSLPDPARAAVCNAERWTRPLFQANKALLLVCPLFDENGDDLHPHPLWDQIFANLADESAAGLLLKNTENLAQQDKSERELRMLPEPQREIDVQPERLLPVDSISPSGLGKFLGCPLAWTLHYKARIKSKAVFKLADGSLAIGSLTHKLVELVFSENPADPTTARDRAVELFDEAGPELYADLFLPGNDEERGRVRNALGKAVHELARLLGERGKEIRETEAEVEKEGLETLVNGRLDIVVGDPTMIVDLKWSGSNYRQKELEAGTAYQLAMYSYLMREDGQSFPPVAYFIMNEQRLLTVDAETFGNIGTIEGLRPEQTWVALEKGYECSFEALSSGNVSATGIPDERGNPGPEESEIDEAGVLVLAVPCRFCDLKVLCGKAFAEGDE